MTLDRDEDMTMTGTRHPFLGKYKVGFNKDGQVTALHVDLFSNAGWSHDFSLFVMRCALFRCEASYYVPNVRFTGRCCKTNLPSNTAFRGFGSKQCMLRIIKYLIKLRICTSSTWIHLLHYHRVVSFRLGRTVTVLFFHVMSFYIVLYLLYIVLYVMKCNVM